MVLLGLLALEIVLYHAAGACSSTCTSHLGHLFGALTGVAIALVSGQNVRFQSWELLLNLLGVLTYIGFCIVVLASGQHAAGGLAFAAVPSLLYGTFRNLRRARARAQTAPQQHAQKPPTTTGSPTARELVAP